MASPGPGRPSPHQFPSISHPRSLFSFQRLYFKHVQRKAMPTLQFVPSIRDSETVTCWHCNTRQFPKDGDCIRCHRTLNVEYVCLEICSPLDQRTDDQPRQLARWIGDLLRSLRNRRGISQSRVATIAGTDRSYLSKAECGRALLPLSKLLPLARSLGLTAIILRFEKKDSLAVSKSSSRR
jgi:ribosome-binding protein aMBF1 (putative translation factor)